jgi:hypothetical protein
MADVGTVSSSFAGTPQWYSEYLKQIAQLGGGLATEEVGPDDLFQGPRIADWTPDQLSAFNMTRDAAGMWKPGFDAAQDAYAASQGLLNQSNLMTAQGAQFDRPTYENTYWDIYKPGVDLLQDQARRIGNEQFENTTLAGLNRNFTGAGGFGSGRHQILGADAAATAQQKIEDTANQAWMGSRQQAMQDYMGWGKQNMQGAQQMGTLAQNQAGLGNNLWDLGTKGTAAMANDAGALAAIGQQQQAMTQANYNLGYQDFQQQQQFPWQQLSNWTGLMQGQQLPQFQTNNSVQMGAGAVTMPTGTYYSPWMSGMQGAAGAAGIIG